MKKKILSLLIISVMALNLTGCAMFESEISDIKGNLVGNGYTIDTFDNYGKRVMTTTGDKINIQGNPVETTSYDSDGSIITGYELSSVITITIDGQEIESCGDTCIFTQKGLEPNVDFTQEDIESNDNGKLSNNTYIANIINKYKNKFGKSRVVVIKSQLGQPITAYSGDKVYWTVPNKLMFNFEESPLKLIIHFGLPMILLCKLLQIIKLLIHHCLIKRRGARLLHCE